jgi:SAM-dependent methyltransferase
MKQLRHRLRQVPYLLSGLTKRSTARVCPACGTSEAQPVATKLFHSLLECSGCALVYRYPMESPEEMQAFYDEGYVEPGLTTELPDDEALARLLAEEFKGSGKDFSHFVRVLQAIGLQPGTRLLDYGANWGYASWQFQRAGFDVQSFEISRPRARFGEKLGLSIATSLSEVKTPLDAVYSCHVLEHVPNPAETIKTMLEMVKPGGLVIGHTPNGSRLFRQSSPATFQKLWGQSHPVLLTDAFVKHVAGDNPCLIASDDNPDSLRSWDRASNDHRDCGKDGLFFVIRREQV